MVLGQDMLEEMEREVEKIRQNLKAAQDRQKVYADRKRTFREFAMGDHVYVRIRPKKSTLRWNSCAKLAPCYCGPFEVLERIGPVAYRLALPSHILVNNVFRVSLLKRYVHDSKHIIHWQGIHLRKQSPMICI